MAVEYKYECWWSQHDGWHFSFGIKRLWECSRGFVVADSTEKDGYHNHEHFEDMKEALDYMRIGRR